MLDFIVDYLQREYNLPEGIDILDFNFVESGYIDSMGLIQFIATLEDEYGVEFSDEDLQSPRLRTVGGLMAIIKERMG